MDAIQFPPRDGDKSDRKSLAQTPLIEYGSTPRKDFTRALRRSECTHITKTTDSSKAVKRPYQHLAGYLLTDTGSLPSEHRFQGSIIRYESVPCPQSIPSFSIATGLAPNMKINASNYELVGDYRFSRSTRLPARNRKPHNFQDIQFLIERSKAFSLELKLSTNRQPGFHTAHRMRIVGFFPKMWRPGVDHTPNHSRINASLVETYN